MFDISRPNHKNTQLTFCCRLVDTIKNEIDPFDRVRYQWPLVHYYIIHNTQNTRMRIYILNLKSLVAFMKRAHKIYIRPCRQIDTQVEWLLKIYVNASLEELFHTHRAKNGRFYLHQT